MKGHLCRSDVETRLCQSGMVGTLVSEWHGRNTCVGVAWQGHLCRSGMVGTLVSESYGRDNCVGVACMKIDSEYECCCS